MTERVSRTLDDLRARQRSGEYMPCPRCGENSMRRVFDSNRLSRAVPSLYICDACSKSEAMLEKMSQVYPLTSWAALQPVRPAGDFKAQHASVAMAEVIRTQIDTLTDVYKRCQSDPRNAEWYRLETFESCPGLTELWTQPFMAKYTASDGAVTVRFKTDEDGTIHMAAGVTEK